MKKLIRCTAVVATLLLFALPSCKHSSNEEEPSQSNSSEAESGTEENGGSNGTGTNSGTDANSGSSSTTAAGQSGSTGTDYYAGVSGTTQASGMTVTADEVVIIPAASTALVAAIPLAGIGSGTVYYMATTADGGSDSNDGKSLEKPFASLRKAIETMGAGDTLYIRGGTYKVTADQIMVTDKTINTQAVNATTAPSGKDTTYTRIYNFSKTGDSSNPISFIGYPGERPVFDFSAITAAVVKPSASDAYRRIAAFHVSGKYHYFKNFELIGVQQNNSSKNQCESIRVDAGSRNTFENLAIHDGMGIGLALWNSSSDNLILNCDAYNNVDTKSDTASNGDGIGGDTDGFGGHPNKNGGGNLFVGCRAWCNSDDGFDLISAYSKVELQSCWAMQNGWADPDHDGKKGDVDITGKRSYSAGNGLKSGGYAYTDVSDVAKNFLDGKVPRHAVTNSIACKNNDHGVYANHHIYNDGAGGGLYYEYNSSYGNAKDYSMETRYKLDVPSATEINQNAKGYTLKNNLNWTLSSKTAYKYIDLSSSDNTLSNNTFQDSSHALTADDFESTDWTELYKARDANGNLPNVNFLKLKSSSHWYNKDVGFSYARYEEQVTAARAAAGCGI